MDTQKLAEATGWPEADLSAIPMRREETYHTTYEVVNVKTSEKKTVLEKPDGTLSVSADIASES